MPFMPNRKSETHAMTSGPNQDILSGLAAQTSTSGTVVTPFAQAAISGTNGADDVVTCYVLNDNLPAGALDASAPAGRLSFKT